MLSEPWEPHPLSSMGPVKMYKLSTREGKPRGSYLISLHVLLHCRSFRDFSFCKQG